MSLYTCDTQYIVTDVIAIFHHIEIRTGISLGLNREIVMLKVKVTLLRANADTEEK